MVTLAQSKHEILLTTPSQNLRINTANLTCWLLVQGIYKFILTSLFDVSCDELLQNLVDGLGHVGRSVVCATQDLGLPEVPHLGQVSHHCSLIVFNQLLIRNLVLVRIPPVGFVQHGGGSPRPQDEV